MKFYPSGCNKVTGFKLPETNLTIQSFNERCIQETLNEYCRNLGLLDDQTVPAEHSSFENYNYARFSTTEDKWLCYHAILTGDGASARSTTCVDDQGNFGATGVLCQAPNEGATEPTPIIDQDVDRTMREIIRHHVEYGCKRMDKIEFTAPKEVLIRCQSGCEPTYKYTRPSKCSTCEENGMTKEYGCVYADEANALLNTAQAATFELCTELCMGNTVCESVKWTETITECKMFTSSWDTNDKTCSIADVIGGRKCHRQGFSVFNESLDLLDSDD